MSAVGDLRDYRPDVPLPVVAVPGPVAPPWSGSGLVPPAGTMLVPVPWPAPVWLVPCRGRRAGEAGMEYRRVVRDD